MDFKLGDRVVAISPVGDNKVIDIKGIVVCFNDYSDPGVEFERYIGGVNLNAVCEIADFQCIAGNGWFCHKLELEHDEDLPALTIETLEAVLYHIPK